MVLPFANKGPAVIWDWVLCNTIDMSEITQLNIHSRQLQDQLDSCGKATGWVHLLDPEVDAIVVHQTALRLDRDGDTVWSGPIWQATDTSAASAGSEEGQDQCQITAMGWFNTLGGSSGQNGRLLHTGAEFQAMMYVNGIDDTDGLMPNYAAWQAQNGVYVPLGIDTAVELAYDYVEFPQTTDAAIIFDLLARANIDSPTLITPGNIYGSPVARNLTLQRFQNVGQEILQLINVESGVDFYIDPVTRQMNLYGPLASASPMINTGMGQDRGAGILFSYPGNCTSVNRSQDGTMTENRMEAIGQYSIGRADDIGSQQLNGLLEASTSLSEVVDPNILVAYAQAEVAVKAEPWTITTWTPRGITSDDNTTSGVPRPYVDFGLGDIVYSYINRGPRLQVGIGSPQATRLFGWTLNIDDSGVEKLTSVMTTYQGTGI